MALFFLILLIILIATGSLMGVLKVAAGVALGVFLGVLLLGAVGFWFARRRFRRALYGDPGRPRPPRPGSRVEVLPPRPPEDRV